MPDDAYRRLAEAVLIVHQRRDAGNCLCGGLELGDSWAAHVADVLADVGALRDRPPTPEDIPEIDEGHRWPFSCPLDWCVRALGHPLPHRDEDAEDAARISEGQWVGDTRDGSHGPVVPTCTRVDWCVLPFGHDGDYHYPPGPTATRRATCSTSWCVRPVDHIGEHRPSSRPGEVGP